MERSLSAQPATLSFTSDFHELLRGCLLPGHDVQLRYDPLRIVPPGDSYVFGDPARAITAHASFGAPGELSVVLESAVGMLPDRQPEITGEGPMLTATIDVPAYASELELWFSFETGAGTVYDSDLGSNFHFGFPRAQISVLKADVSGEKKPKFILEVSAVSDVHHVAVRIHPAKPGDFAPFDANLEDIDALSNGWRRWTLNDVNVPAGEIVRFKLYYWIGDRRYKEDNDGIYYLAPAPPQKKVPVPPRALAAALKRWS